MIKGRDEPAFQISVFVSYLCQICVIRTETAVSLNLNYIEKTPKNRGFRCIIVELDYLFEN